MEIDDGGKLYTFSMERGTTIANFLDDEYPRDAHPCARAVRATAWWSRPARTTTTGRRTTTRSTKAKLLAQNKGKPTPGEPQNESAAGRDWRSSSGMRAQTDELEVPPSAFIT